MKEKSHKNEGGKSSFKMVDTDKLFDKLNLEVGSSFLDVGCGKGEYVLAARKYVGEKGLLYGIDKWEEGIKQLKEQASKENIKNITAMVGDVSNRIPLKDNSIDVCLLSTVLHGLISNKMLSGTMDEISRVLKVGGLLAIIEWKKVEGPPGPPIDIRITPEEIKKTLEQYGFELKEKYEIGDLLHLTVFFN